MATAKSVFEHAPASGDTSPKLTKKASKWDKPKPVPPPAVNRDADNADTSADPELPPPAYTKNMLAKFQSMRQSDGPMMSDSRVESSKPKKVRSAACFLVRTCVLASSSSPFPQVDVIGAMVIVWRVRGKIVRSVLCNIVCNSCAQCNAHTYEQT